MKTLQSLKQIYFPVEKLSVGAWKEGAVGVGSKKHVVIGYPKGKETFINACADRYNLKKNIEIFPRIEEILKKAKLEYTIKVQHVDFSKFFVEFLIKDKEFSVGTGKDVIYPRIYVETSYNGEVDYHWMFGWFRLICSNGLVVPVEGKEEENFYSKGKHTPSMEESFEQLEAFVGNFLSNAKDTLKRFEVLTDRMVPDYADRLEEVINVMSKKTRLPKKTLEPALETVTTEMGYLNMSKANDWLIYNAINKGLYSDDLNKIQNHIRTDIDQKVLQYIIKNPFN